MDQLAAIKYPLIDAELYELDELLSAMGTEANAGISKTEAIKRGADFGLNNHKAQQQKKVWAMLLDQFKSPIVYLLFIAATASLYFEETMEAIAILIVIVVNAMIGFFMELQARSSMRALRKMDVSLSKVLRSGKVMAIPSENIVPGDIVLLEAGDLVTADGRLVESNQLSCDEASLTGESFPIIKNIAKIEEKVELGDTLNMVFKGTSIMNGNGKFVVTGIGTNTELGKITNLVANAQSTATPLDKKISNLTGKLIWITLGMTAIYAITGLIQGRSWLLVLETSIALAVAAFPEGLPIV
ncbi:MAG: ATPase, partial [Flavobacterium sp.]